MAASRRQRLALNEAAFRVANERMAAWPERHEDAAVEQYFCECVDLACRAKVPLRRAEYERVRADSAHFVVVPGHEATDVEHVIARTDRYAVVEKEPGVEREVQATDPRRG